MAQQDSQSLFGSSDEPYHDKTIYAPVALFDEQGTPSIKPEAFVWIYDKSFEIQAHED